MIYYYRSESMPLYLLAVFAKSEMENLSKAERNVKNREQGRREPEPEGPARTLL